MLKNARVVYNSVYERSYLEIIKITHIPSEKRNCFNDYVIEAKTLESFVLIN